MGAAGRLSMIKWVVAAMLFPLLASGCSSVNPISTPVWTPPATPTLIFRPTKPPTATAGVFELRPSSTPIPTHTPIVVDLMKGFGLGPGGFPLDINPLTGLRVEDPAILNRRPMVVKITNFPLSVRPQWGLTVADHVYEYYLEDELTRFVGIFYGKDAERVGPIRSARPFDEHLIRMYKGIFAFAYADDRLIDFWKDTDISPFMVFEKPDNCPPMCRIGSKNNYNTLFADTHLLTDYVGTRDFKQERQDLSGLRFERSTTVANSGSGAQRVEIHFSPSSYNYWQYHPATYRYYRWQDVERRAEGNEIYEPLFDSLTAQQIHADNLVILQVPMIYFFKSNSTDVYDFQLIGQGEAFALREGRIYSILWRRPTKESLISLTFPNGAPYPLKPGNIWFEVLSQGSSHTINGETWHFSFVIPENMPGPTATTKPKKGSP